MPMVFVTSRYWDKGHIGITKLWGEGGVKGQAIVRHIVPNKKARLFVHQTNRKSSATADEEIVGEDG